MIWFRIALLLALGSWLGCRRASVADAKPPSAAVPSDARTHFGRAVQLLDKGAEHYDAALAEFEAAIAIAPDLWEAWLDIGLLHMRRGRLGAASKALHKSVEIYPSSEGLEALGDAYLRQRQADKAVDLYERALTRSPTDTSMRVRLAISLRRAGRTSEAEAELRATLGQTPDPLAYATLAALELERGNVDLAELVLAQGLKKHPDHPALLTNLGLVAWARGDDSAAFERFEQASRVDPSFLLGRLNAAAVYLGAGDHARAETELQYVLNVEPGNVDALLGLGIAKRLGGDVSSAKRAWERALAIDPDNAAAHFNLAVLAMDFSEQPAAARKHLERYLQLAPQDDGHIAAANDRIALLDALAKG